MAYKINTAVVGFGVGHFIKISDGSSLTSGTIVCKEIIDGTARTLDNVAAYNDTAAVWETDLSAADMNGTHIVLTFSIADYLPISYTLKTETKLVSELNDATQGNTVVPPTVDQMNARTIVSADYAVAGDEMALEDNAITASKYDESTAFPLTAVNGSSLTEAGGTGDQLTEVNLPDQSMNLTGNITGNLVGDVTGKVDGTVAGKTPSEIGDEMNLKDDAVKAAKYDESTAFPLTAVNGSTLTEAGGTGDQLTAITDGLDKVPKSDGSVVFNSAAESGIVQALYTESMPELTSPPVAVPNLKQAIMLPYMALRNKQEQDRTAGTQTITNNAGLTIAESDVSDLATVFTKSEFRAPTP